MNYSQPFFICHENEDFRALLREMLTKLGYYHILEISSQSRLLESLHGNKKAPFYIIQGELLNEDISKYFQKKNDLIIISQSQAPKMLSLSAQFGVSRLLSFPFSSQILAKKIEDIS